MKKLSLLLMAVAFLCPKVANAQDGKGSINFVPYVGVNYSDFSGDSDYYFGGTSGKVNLMVGTRFEFQIADKSAFITDVNYRRLGATADACARYSYGMVSLLPGEIQIGPGPYKVGKGTVFGDFDKDKIHREAKENIGYVDEFTKVTLDCISLAVQFKQNIIDGLSLRAGLECIGSLSEKWHYHEFDYKKTGECEECYDAIDADGYFSDHLNAAIPLGLTYDCNNFSINATYHLPITKCNGDKNPDFSNQAFDLTIGYRLPLRKR